MKLYNEKIYGIVVHKANSFSISKKTGKKKYNSFKTFYDLKYTIGTDELEVPDMLKMIRETDTSCSKKGYTGRLRKEMIIKEPFCPTVYEHQPSLGPIVYTKTLQEFVNVQCWDITSAYPYLLTQPLPHYDKEVKFESEEMFENSNFTYYGALKIFNLKAKKPYFPLTLVGKNNKGIKAESQGIDIIHHGVRIQEAKEVTLFGFIPHLLELLKRNYDYDNYMISKNLIQFKLEIDQELRVKILENFEKKQTKKRNGENYKGEKIFINRIYGFFITKGSRNPAHFGQYVVSKERLIIDRLISKIGLKDIVQSHTDSIKFVGNHEEVINEYNATVEFAELGKFAREDVFQKCVYYSNIIGKYIDKNGKLNFKHGGINEFGIRNLYKMKYEDITQNTEFQNITGFYYLKGEGYFPDYCIRTFAQSVDMEVESDE